MPYLRGWLIIIVGLCLSMSITQAQGECGVVDNITYPVDTNSFALTQQYAVPSPRHQGRYHVGEDWYGERDNTLGQPVRAAARGRVTYTYELGWGRDGGVVILQHTLPDGTIFYTQYGHLQANATYPLPSRLSCVEQGAVIGAIGNARPAPHLHFEIRTTNGADPGPGYTWETPHEAGYRQPRKFITNLQIELNVAQRWRVTVGDGSAVNEAGILDAMPLSDESVLYLDSDGSTSRRATPDGRVLWRQSYAAPAVSVMGFQGQPLVALADGTLQFISTENGTPVGESWQVEAQFTGAPISAGEQLIYPAANDELVVVSADRRSITQRWQNIPPFYDAQLLANGNLALLTDAHALLLLAADGSATALGQLRERGDLASSWAGELLVYSKGGLWQVSLAGEWSLYIEAVPGGGERGALLRTDDALYAFDGDTLHAYDRNRELLWQTGIPAVTGQVELSEFESAVLLTSSAGDIDLASREFGRLCNFMQMYGTPHTRQWQHLGADGILRVAIADSIVGLDWATLTQNC